MRNKFYVLGSTSLVLGMVAYSLGGGPLTGLQETIPTLLISFPLFFLGVVLIGWGYFIKPQIEMVTFTDVELMANEVKLPFVNDQGEYERPNLVIAGGRVQGDFPDILDCPPPSSFVIYSSEAAWVPFCQGYGGPNDGNNRIIKKARKNAKRIADQIDCGGECTKNDGEIWKGWNCNRRGNKFIAIAAVELKINCNLPDIA